jgi:Carboxypeptidase regulatory-like domain
MQPRRYRYLLLLLLAVFGTSALRAAVTGTISGFVRDSTGANIPNASLVVTDTTTNLTQEAHADSQGQYTFLALPPGRYKIVATLTGFKAATINDIDLKVNDQLRLDITLAVGSIDQSISIEANALQVQTSSTALGTVVESNEMLALPLNGRSYLDLLSLQPGVAPRSTVAATDRPVDGLFSAPGNVSVNGQPESANAFLVNGAEVNETKNEGAGLVPNIDSVQEFRLLTNSFDASYGKFTGAIMNTITKTGTNRIHGDGFWFYRNDAMDSRGWFDLTKAILKRNQFGYAVGGPIFKNRLFWFTDYQGTRQDQSPSTGNVTVPTAAQIGGSFGSLLTKSVNGAGWAGVLSQRLGYTVTSGEAYSLVFPGGVIPASAFATVPKNEIAAGYIPLPNVNATQYSNSSQVNTVRDDKAGQRIDFVNQKTGNWSFYYHFDDSTALNNFASSSVPGFPTNSPSRAQMFNMSNSKPIGTTMVNMARASFFRTAIFTAQPAGATSPTALSALGFTVGTGLGIIPSGPSGYPQYVPHNTFNNFSFGYPQSNMRSVENNYTFEDSLSKIVGRHSLSFGGEYRYYQLNVRNICDPNGEFTFDGTETGSDIADFELGAPSVYIQCSQQLLDNRANYGAVFGQDSWKAKSNLTLNMGLRYEVAQPWWDKYSQLNTFIKGVQSIEFPTAPLGYLVPGDPGVPKTISSTSWGNVGPRLGVAYSPDQSNGLWSKLFGGPGRSSIRAAFGIYYLGAADSGNFGVIGSAPWGQYWTSIAPVSMGTPFQTRSTQASQTQRFPFVQPHIGDPANKTLNFAQYEPIVGPGYNVNNRITYSEHYNLTIQRQITNSMVFSIGYVGTESHRVAGDFNINPGNGPLCLQLAAQAKATPGNTAPICGPNGEKQTYTINGVTTYGTLQGMGNQQLGTVAFGKVHLNTNIANSSYNSLQTSLERRSSNFTFVLAYTYSKSIDDATTTFNPANLKQNRVLSPFDLTNNFVASYTYTIPFDKAFRAVPNRITQGWMISGITRLASGFPITLSQSGDIALTGFAFDFPNVAGPVVKHNPRASSAHTYFDKSAFTTELPGIIGDAPARFIHGPGINNTDLGLKKNTRINESMSFVLGGEFFNVFNHANFANPGGSYSSSSFGNVTSVQSQFPARIGQVSAKFIF